MSYISIALHLLGVLFVLYVLAAIWQSKDAPSGVKSHSPKPKR
jgi:hypothetical protein